MYTICVYHNVSRKVLIVTGVIHFGSCMNGVNQQYLKVHIVAGVNDIGSCITEVNQLYREVHILSHGNARRPFDKGGMSLLKPLGFRRVGIYFTELNFSGVDRPRVG